MLIIGGTGDLSRRHLLPALARLLANGELPDGFSLTVTGLEPMTAEGCRDLLGRELSAHAADLPADARRSLVGRTSYLHGDVRDESARWSLPVQGPLLVYLATPPQVVPAALRAISRAEVHRSSRIVLDKPFGLSRVSARALNAQLADLTDENNVYRVDHFLYHHAVQELVRWRVQSDPLSIVDLLPAAQVEIVWDETRAPSSNNSTDCGVLRDMVQSHLLQLLAVLTMESPESMTRADLARSRLDALRRMSAPADAGSAPVRGHHIRDSEANLSSTKEIAAETFVRLELRSLMPRWEGVPFFLQAAKGVEQSRRHIELRLARASGSVRSSIGFVRLEVLAGNLVLGLVDGEASGVEFSLTVDTESASTRLLRAALLGDDTFTLHAQEPEEAWRIVEPILQTWERGDAPMLSYRVGAPVASIAEPGAELRG